MDQARLEAEETEREGGREERRSPEEGGGGATLVSKVADVVVVVVVVVVIAGGDERSDAGNQQGKMQLLGWLPLSFHHLGRTNAHVHAACATVNFRYCKSRVVAFNKVVKILRQPTSTSEAKQVFFCLFFADSRTSQHIRRVDCSIQ